MIRRLFFFRLENLPVKFKLQDRLAPLLKDINPLIKLIIIECTEMIFFLMTSLFKLKHRWPEGAFSVKS